MGQGKERHWICFDVSLLALSPIWQGELMVRVRPDTDGTLEIVNAVVKADEAESAMDIPRGAM